MGLPLAWLTLPIWTERSMFFLLPSNKPQGQNRHLLSDCKSKTKQRNNQCQYVARTWKERLPCTTSTILGRSAASCFLAGGAHEKCGDSD